MEFIIDHFPIVFTVALVLGVLFLMSMFPPSIKRQEKRLCLFCSKRIPNNKWGAHNCKEKQIAMHFYKKHFSGKGEKQCQ